MSWPWHNSGDQRPVFICNVYSPKSRLLRRRAVTPPSAPAGSCWAANPSRSARLCSSSARSMVTKYYCSRSFVHIHSTAGLLLERGYAGKGMVQEDLLGLPHPKVAAGQGGLPLPRLRDLLDVPHVALGVLLLLQSSTSHQSISLLTEEKCR